MDNDAIADLFAGLGPVDIRRLFGGKGIYFDNVIIAIDLRGELMLKGDAQLASEFEAAGCRQWSYVENEASENPCRSTAGIGVHLFLEIDIDGRRQLAVERVALKHGIGG